MVVERGVHGNVSTHVSVTYRDVSMLYRLAAVEHVNFHLWSGRLWGVCGAKLVGGNRAILYPSVFTRIHVCPRLVSVGQWSKFCIVKYRDVSACVSYDTAYRLRIECVSMDTRLACIRLHVPGASDTGDTDADTRGIAIRGYAPCIRVYPHVPTRIHRWIRHRYARRYAKVEKPPPYPWIIVNTPL